VADGGGERSGRRDGEGKRRKRETKKLRFFVWGPHVNTCHNFVWGFKGCCHIRWYMYNHSFLYHHHFTTSLKKRDKI